MAEAIHQRTRCAKTLHVGRGRRGGELLRLCNTIGRVVTMLHGGADAERVDAAMHRLLLGKVHMRAIDARIEHRPDDALAQCVERALGRIRLDRRERARECDGNVAVFPDAVDDRVVATILRVQLLRLHGKLLDLRSLQATEDVTRYLGEAHVPELGTLFHQHQRRREATTKQLVQRDDHIERPGRIHLDLRQQRFGDDGAEHVAPQVLACLELPGLRWRTCRRCGIGAGRCLVELCRWWRILGAPGARSLLRFRHGSLRSGTTRTRLRDPRGPRQS